MISALVVLSNSVDTTSIARQANIPFIFTSNYSALDKQLADTGIQLEEKILVEHQQIDSVLVVMKNSDIDYSTLSNIELANDTVYYPIDDCTVAFYCQSHVFSAISNLYKLDFNKYHFKNLENDTVELLAEKILFMINRAGFDLNVR